MEWAGVIAVLIDSEQTLLSIEAQLCTRTCRVQNILTTKAFFSCNAQSACETLSYLYSHVNILRLSVDSYLGN